MAGQRLIGKVALITGAASGIGRGVAAHFAAEGAKVVAFDIADAVGETVATIRESGGDAVAFRGSVAIDGDAARAVETAVSAYGGLDILCNVAGIMPLGTVLTQSEEEWDRTLAVNLKSVFLCARHAIPVIEKRSGGNVVNIASVTGVLGHNGLAAYSASKGGVIALTRAMAVDHAPQRIRVNCICPGTIDTGILRDYLGTVRDVDAAMQGFVANHLLGRIGTPDDIASAALYLASDEASFVTGATFMIDGGYTIGKTQPT